MCFGGGKCPAPQVAQFAVKVVNSLFRVNKCELVLTEKNQSQDYCSKRKHQGGCKLVFKVE